MRYATLVVVVCLLAGRTAADEIVVVLRPKAVAADGPVLVGHVATVSGGTEAQRRRIAGLDIADAPLLDAVTLPRDLVDMRIRLAGVERADYRILGPAKVEVTRSAAAVKADNPVLVKPRDTVTLKARVGTMRLICRGEALQEGRAGDRIRVRNVDSKREVVGRVVERGVVEVDF